MATSNAIITVCETNTPALESIAPVRKGNAAEPACPTLAANPESPSVKMTTRNLELETNSYASHIPIAPLCTFFGTVSVRTYGPTG